MSRNYYHLTPDGLLERLGSEEAVRAYYAARGAKSKARQIEELGVDGYRQRMADQARKLKPGDRSFSKNPELARRAAAISHGKEIEK